MESHLISEFVHPHQALAGIMLCNLFSPNNVVCQKHWTPPPAPQNMFDITRASLRLMHSPFKGTTGPPINTIMHFYDPPKVLKTIYLN